MRELLRMAQALELAGVGAKWHEDLDSLARALGVDVPAARAAISPTFALALHQALSRRVLTRLEDHYQIKESEGAIELLPRTGRPEMRVLGLHGADDRGRSFAAVFAELLLERKAYLLCPTSRSGSWSSADYRILSAQFAEGRGPRLPVFVIGFSAGANAALELREHILPTGAIAVAAAPSLVQSRALGIPTLYVHGTEDALFSAEEIRRTLEPRSLEDWPDPQAELVCVPGFGHGYPYRVLVRHALPFMDRLSGKRPTPVLRQGDSVR